MPHAAKRNELANEPTGTPRGFASSEEMNIWANALHPGATVTELIENEWHLAIWFREFESNKTLRETHVFLKRDERWQRILTGPVLHFKTEARIQGNELILWHAGKNLDNGRDYLRLDLETFR